jgi:hypothetical protein
MGARLEIPDRILAHVLDGARPKRIAAPTGSRSRSNSRPAAGTMLMPRASLMYFTTFSVLPVSDVSRAAMNSTGSETSDAVWYASSAGAQ